MIHAVNGDYDRTLTLCGRPGSEQHIKRIGGFVFVHGLRALPIATFLAEKSELRCCDCFRAIQRDLAVRSMRRQRL